MHPSVLIMMPVRKEPEKPGQWTVDSLEAYCQAIPEARLCAEQISGLDHGMWRMIIRPEADQSEASVYHA